MSRYKKKVICPLDGSKLGWEELVETRANDVYTYHCKDCNTYWHVDWFKDRKPNGSFNWNYELVYDDFGKAFKLK